MILGGFTATGPREANEDNYYVVDFSDVRSFTNGVTSFVMVSDGMGGYQGGDVASSLAVSSAESYIGQLLEMAEGNQVELDAEYALTEIAQNAHEAILAETRERGSSNMGATFVGAFLSPTHAWIGHIGDSRAYLIRKGVAIQLTEDHSQVGRMLSQGLITEEEAQNHPARNRIERALGFSDATPEMNEVDLEPGDILLLCSDGVYTVLDSAEISSCVGNARNAENAATRVVKSALSGGTDDNSTAVVVLNASGKSPKAATGSYKVQPTIRTSAVAQPKHGAADRYRPSAYMAGQRPSARQLAANKRPARTIVIPVVVGVVLVAVLVGVFLAVGGTSVGSVGSGGGSGSGSATASAPQGSNEATQSTPAATPALPAASANPGSVVASYAVGDNAVLKYIDSSNIAHTFDEDGIVNVYLIPNSHVRAETHVDSYGQTDKSYQALSSDYRTDLLNDRSSFIAGERSFNSPLSQIVDADSYLRFVEEIANTYDNATLTRKIDRLVVDKLDESSPVQQ